MVNIAINGIQIIALLFFAALAIAYRLGHPAGSMGLGLDANGNTVAAAIKYGSVARDDLNASAEPWKLARSDAGISMARSARWIAATASPSATPDARLNEIVTAGNWSW